MFPTMKPHGNRDEQAARVCVCVCVCVRWNGLCVVLCLLFVVCCLLFVVCCLLFVFCLLRHHHHQKAEQNYQPRMMIPACRRSCDRPGIPRVLCKAHSVRTRPDGLLRTDSLSLSLVVSIHTHAVLSHGRLGKTFQLQTQMTVISLLSSHPRFSSL